MLRTLRYDDAQGFVPVPQHSAPTADLFPRCTCRGRCRGHAIRKDKEKKFELDLESAEVAPWTAHDRGLLTHYTSWSFEASWTGGGGRTFDVDFRAPVDVPSEHPTHAQEVVRRRHMIYALNRAMKARDERLLAEYVALLVPERLERCLECRFDQLARRGFERFRDAVRALTQQYSVS